MVLNTTNSIFLEAWKNFLAVPSFHTNHPYYFDSAFLTVTPPSDCLLKLKHNDWQTFDIKMEQAKFHRRDFLLDRWDATLGKNMISPRANFMNFSCRKNRFHELKSIAKKRKGRSGRCMTGKYLDVDWYEKMLMLKYDEKVYRGWTLFMPGCDLSHANVVEN